MNNSATKGNLYSHWCRINIIPDDYDTLVSPIFCLDTFRLPQIVICSCLSISPSIVTAKDDHQRLTLQIIQTPVAILKQSVNNNNQDATQSTAVCHLQWIVSCLTNQLEIKCKIKSFGSIRKEQSEPEKAFNYFRTYK